MRVRRRPEDRGRDAAPAALASSPLTPAQFVARLQRSVGNARVSRMLAPHELERPVETVAPHEPDDRSEDLLALGPGAFGEPEEEGAPLDLFAQAETSAAPATTNTPATTKAPASTNAPLPAVPADVAAWLAQQPIGNADVAAWLPAGEKLGFITFRDDGRPQIADLAAGKSEVRAYVGDRSKLKPQKVDTSKRSACSRRLRASRAAARRWTADMTQAKWPVETGELIRNLTGSIPDAHAAGASADLFSSFDWDGSKGPRQIIEVLQDQPKGTYTIGLPMQGEFFPKAEYLANTQKDTLAKGATQTPNSLIYYSTAFWRSTYDPSLRPDYPWKDERIGGLVVTRLKSTALQSALTALAGVGTTLKVMPDQNNHIHITRH
jgi:hypothetical protein